MPPNSGFGDYYKAEGSGDKQFDLFSYMVDDNFIKTMGLDLIKGRGFSKGFGSNADGVILNESAVKSFGWDDPLGKTLNYPSWGDYKVIGIIKDFNFFSLHLPIMPFALFHNSSKSYDIAQSYVAVKIRSTDVSKSIDDIEKEWNKLAPGSPFTYSFLDDALNSQYRSEQRLGNIFMIFASLAILIACLGLLGLAAFTAEKRKREIGIRKTLGATVYNVLILLTKDFTKWVLIANIIAVPIAWYAMDTWLQNFAYRIEISYWEFITAGLAALLIAILTVAFQAIKAAIQNPVDSIKYE
jgi:putative ABC transport system permease protein